MIDYFEQGHMKNDAYYVGELRQQCQEIARKRRGKLTRCVLLLRDNAPAHTSQVGIPCRVVQKISCLTTDVCLTADPGVVSSIPAQVQYFCQY